MTGRGHHVIWRATLLGVVLLAVLGGVTTYGHALPGLIDPALNTEDNDNDGVTDMEERERYGTNPAKSDSDSDGFTDGEEVDGQTVDGTPLPDAEPAKKDLYIVIHRARGIAPFTQRERLDLKQIFQDMPVSNPDGTHGIRLHVNPTFISAEEPDINSPYKTKHDAELADSHYRNADQYKCSAHQVLLVEIKNQSVKGWGDAPGFQVLVEGRNTRSEESKYTERTVSIVHELLHNVVGKLRDGRMHTDEGWLNDEGEYHDGDLYLNMETRHTLNQRGFADREKYYSC